MAFVAVMIVALSASVYGRTRLGKSVKAQTSNVITVNFDKFPATINEWKDMQSKLGGEPQGAVALQVMAFELYRTNRADGEQALRLNNISTNYNSTVERLREIMGKDKYMRGPTSPGRCSRALLPRTATRHGLPTPLR